MQYSSHKDTKSGSAILLTLIITMIVLTTALVLGSIIASSIRRSSISGNAYLAYYGAESMIEKTLYDLRKGSVGPSAVNTNLSDTNCKTNYRLQDISSDITCRGSLEYFTSPSNFTGVKVNKSVQVKLVNTASESPGAGVKTLEVSCKDTDGGPQAWMEVTLYSIGVSGTWRTVTDDRPLRKYAACTTAPLGLPAKITFSELDPNSSYFVDIRALNDDITLMTTTAKNSAGNILSLGEYFTITASADYPYLTRQEIQVEVQGISTVSPIFDYVLYSETTLTKTVGQPSAT